MFIVQWTFTSLLTPTNMFDQRFFFLTYACCVPMCQPEPICQPGCFEPNCQQDRANMSTETNVSTHPCQRVNPEPICQPKRANMSTRNQYVNPIVPICQPVFVMKIIAREKKKLN